MEVGDEIIEHLISVNYSLVYGQCQDLVVVAEGYAPSFSFVVRTKIIIL